MISRKIVTSTPQTPQRPNGMEKVNDQNTFPTPKTPKSPKARISLGGIKKLLTNEKNPEKKKSSSNSLNSDLFSSSKDSNVI